MTLDTALGQPALFRLEGAEGYVSDMSVRERRLLVGALNFHALMAPGRELVVHAYDGDWTSLPRTTDDSTFNGRSRAFRERIATFSMTSAVAAEERDAIPAEDAARALVAHDARHIHISTDDVLDFDPPRDVATGGVRGVLRKIRTHSPLLYDEARDLELLRHRRSWTKPVVRRDYDQEFASGGAHADSTIVPAPEAREGAQGAVLIGLHWLELGGAERWAFETIKLVREAGLLPIVLTNRDSHHAWAHRAELDGAVVIPFSEATVLSQTAGVEELLRGILATFDVRGVVVHHNQWLYDRLPWIVRSRPGIPVIDSTHIVEYRGGGYPVSSAMAERSITTHHVISPRLAKWMTDVQGIQADKVVMAPLGGLTVSLKDVRFREREDGDRFTIAFVGRMARQKAPEVFIATVARLVKSGMQPRVIMHGEGELASAMDDLIGAVGLTSLIERRDSSVPVDQTLADAHLLVVSSHNEGLTLTTLEAIAHGVPVVSTDVGAQSDIVPRRALTQRGAHRAVNGLTKIVAALAVDEDSRRALWREERKAEKRLLSTTSANEWFAGEVAQW